MKEITFLKQNADKWKNFETIIKKPKKANPDTIAELYIELTDDLAYSQTFFPDSKTTSYLNALAIRFHHALYKNKKEDSNRIITFWKTEQPLLFYKHRKQLLLAFIIFSIAILIGWISSAYDATFVRLIMGDSYVKMTLDNIEKGDPMAVYKSMTGTTSFIAITVNNIKVAFLAFAAGLLFSFGTGYILLFNGIMLGAFHYFFYEKGLLFISVLSIWIHGTLEISAIIIAGCGGFIMGNSFLFPATFSRLESFKHGAKQGIKIIIGIVPVFIVAGFLEGYITRFTKMPKLLSITIILASLLFVIWYYVIYPVSIVKKAENEGK